MVVGDSGRDREAAVRFSRMKIWRLMVVVAVIGVALGIFLREWRRQRMIEAKRDCLFRGIEDLATDFGDFTKIPLAQSSYLRDVAEPITMIRGPHVAGSDNHWMGIVFGDANGVERSATYDFYVYRGEDSSNTLRLEERKVPPGGAEERAFLGLLQRWYLQDAEARDFYDRLKRVDFPKLSERQEAKVIGVSMLLRLLKRD